MSNIASLLGLPLDTVFLAYVGQIGGSVAAALLRYLPVRRAGISIAIVGIWLGYAGGVGYSGIVGDPTLRPPGILFLVAPILAFTVVIIGRSPAGQSKEKIDVFQ